MSFLDIITESKLERCDRLIRDYTRKRNAALARADTYKKNLAWDYAQKQEELANSLGNMIDELEKVREKLQ